MKLTKKKSVRFLNNFYSPKKIPENIRNKSEIQSKDGSYTSFKFDFFPMSLTANSGSRIFKLIEDEKGPYNQKIRICSSHISEI